MNVKVAAMPPMICMSNFSEAKSYREGMDRCLLGFYETVSQAMIAAMHAVLLRLERSGILGVYEGDWFLPPIEVKDDSAPDAPARR